MLNRLLRLFDDFEGENEIDDTEIVDDNEISQDRWIVGYVSVSNQKRILVFIFKKICNLLNFLANLRAEALATGLLIKKMCNV